MLKELTEKILRGEDLAFAEANGAVNGILDGHCSDVSIAGFLTALAAKGEAAQEVGGMAKGLRDHAIGVEPVSRPLVDVVGTGGDGRATFNISTTAALVAAGAGVSVAKHGNRAITSKCGSADILAQLGVKIDAAPEVIARCVDKANIGFMFAPNHHPTMKYVQPIRKGLGYRTVFNMLGPLANPARAEIMVIGVAKPEWMAVMAEAVKLMGVSRAMVVHGGGTDELSICGPTDVIELQDGKISSRVVDCRDYGIAVGRIKELAGGSLEKNAEITRGILTGETAGACRDVVVFNAAAAILLAGLAKDFGQAIELASESIASGKAQWALDKLVEISNS